MTCGCNSHNGLLMAKGLEEAAQRRDNPYALASMPLWSYLDKVDSVSGVRRDETMVTPWPTDEQLDEQYRRFLDEVEVL